MEIKKIIILLLTVKFVTLLLFLFGDISQYKQIGDTNFYLLPNEIGQESFLYHNGGKEGVFYPIYHKGLVHDVYWNKQYIIIKCNQKKVENWYIIRNIEVYDYSKLLLSDKTFLSRAEKIRAGTYCRSQPFLVTLLLLRNKQPWAKVIILADSRSIVR